MSTLPPLARVPLLVLGLVSLLTGVFAGLARLGVEVPALAAVHAGNHAALMICAFFGTARKERVAYAAGFTGLGVAATRFAGEVMLDLLAGERTERTELQMVRGRPLPFPPEPAAAAGINLTRWSLDRADHDRGRRNLLLKTLDALGLGFDS